MAAAPLGWLGIVRLGLVKTALGAIVVLTTTTINRVMVVELALPVMLPGALVAFHYALQVLRPQIGHGSDVGGRRTPWIIGGMAVLAAGGVGAAIATAWMSTNLWAGIALAVVAFGLVGLGVAGAGTSLLVLLALRVAPRRRPAAATIVWIMMIAGFAIAPTVAGRLLDPYSPSRLVAVTAGVSGIAFLLAVLAVWGVEGRAPATAAPGPQPATRAAKKSSFREAFAEVWREPHARLFAIFIAVSMLAYSGQELILEPFAGTVFGLTPGGDHQPCGAAARRQPARHGADRGRGQRDRRARISARCAAGPLPDAWLRRLRWPGWRLPGRSAQPGRCRRRSSGLASPTASTPPPPSHR